MDKDILQLFLVDYNRYAVAFNRRVIQFPLTQADVDVIAEDLHQTIVVNTPSMWNGMLCGEPSELELDAANCVMKKLQQYANTNLLTVACTS